MKHIHTFESFLNEKKEDTFTAYIEDSRSFRPEDIKRDYNLVVKNHDRRGFDVVGKKEDIEDFVADYAVVLPEEGIQVYESASINEGDMTNMYDGFIASSTDNKVQYKFRYQRGVQNTKVENAAFEKMMKETGKPRGSFWVTGFVKKGEFDKDPTPEITA
jgi:hypothetical protein